MFSVKAERIDENVQDQSKLRFSSNDLSIVRYLVDQVDIFQHKSRVLIVSNKTFPLKNSYKKSSKLRETQPASRLTYLGRESWSKATKSTENWRSRRSRRDEEAHSSRHLSVAAPPPLPPFQTSEPASRLLESISTSLLSLRETVSFVSPRQSRGEHCGRRETKLIVSQGTKH